MIENKYKKWYGQIIERARGRMLEGYVERHHAIPRSLGGSNADDNIVTLTYREHFLAHWLLTKFTEGEALRKMQCALGYMTRGRKKRTSWQFERSRKAMRDAKLGWEGPVGNKNHQGHKHSPETIAKMRRPRYEGFGEKMRQIRLGARMSAETRAKISASMKAYRSAA